MAHGDDSHLRGELVLALGVPAILGGELPADIAGPELAALPVIGIPVGTVGAAGAARLAAPDGLQAVGDARLPIAGRIEIVPHGHEQATHEDVDPPEIVAVEVAELRVEPAIQRHLGYETT